jgi:hypothetical protein
MTSFQFFEATFRRLDFVSGFRWNLLFVSNRPVYIYLKQSFRGWILSPSLLSWGLINRASLQTFHLKTETDSSLQNVVYFK